ncbi:MAG: FAD-dependent oxidoreductase [Patescibacteria group bacterium]
MKTDYDVIVMGAGSAGLTAAVGASKIGKSVLLIEREHMGGECTNSGCIPSKALLHHAKAYYTAKKIAGENGKSETYRKEAFSYVRSIVESIVEEEQPENFEKLGIDVVMGEATFNAKCSLTVNGKSYTYKNAIIATGSSPRMLKVQGLDQADILTNQNIFALDDVPKRTLIIGSGPIGMEMGQAFSMLGSEVTMATIDAELGRLEDPAIRPKVQAIFADLSVRTFTRAHLTHVEDKVAVFEIKNEAGDVVGEERVAYDKILIAIGRVPNIPEGLEKAGIKADERCVMVDSQHRTSNKYVYAIGDVAQRLKFTHTADDVARQVVTKIASRGWLRITKKKAVPKVTYVSPEIAQVGISWEEAKQKYDEREIMRIEVPYSLNDRAKTDSTTDGLLVVVARRVNGAVLGANLIGPAAGEILSIFTIAIDKKISMWGLRSIIYAYPTYSLVIKKAGDQFFAQQIADIKKDVGNIFKKHAPKVFALFFWGILIYAFQDYRISNDLSYQDVLFQLLDFFTSTVYGPLIYMVLYALRPLIFFPATLLTALSGALFGFWWGVIYTIIGENASANFAYWIGRFFGKGLKLEDSIIGNWVEALRKRPFESVLFMRLFYVPFDLTNYGSGILKIKWSSYFIATLIGIMPGLTTFVALGSAIDLESFKMDGLSFNAFDPKFLALSVGIFVASLALSRVLKKWQADA